MLILTYESNVLRIVVRKKGLSNATLTLDSARNIRFTGGVLSGRCDSIRLKSRNFKLLVWFVSIENILECVRTINIYKFHELYYHQIYRMLQILG